MTAPTRLGAAAAAALLVVLTACSGAGPDNRPRAKTSGPAASTTATPVPKAPPEEACYVLTSTELASPTNDSDPVPCTAAHTARTIHVGELDLVRGGHAVAIDSASAQRQLAEVCPERLAGFLGGDAERLRLSRFQVVWFSPTLAQADLGAHWFRCDVVAFGTDDELATFVRGDRLRGALDAPDALTRYGLCGTAPPGAPGFHRVVCAEPHTWVAVSTIDLAGEEYPGEAAVRDEGEPVCSDRVRTDNDFILEFTYGWEWPTAEQWATGRHYGYCWAPTELAG